MPIRWRLTLWFALILSVIFILSGAVLNTLLQKSLLNQVDENLIVYSAKVHGTLHPQVIPDPLDYDVIHSKLPTLNEFASPGIYIEIIDKNGNVVVKSSSLGEQELPVSPSLIARGFAGEVVLDSVAAGGNTSVRIMVSPLYLQDQFLVLEVAQSLNHVEVAMGQVRLALFTSTILALLLAIVSGGVLVRRALSPVSRISQIARSIETGSDLNRRVGYSGPGDEIGELATTFDHMIEHLDRVFQSQRSFVADASHELRSPLTVIRGNMDLLKRNLSEEDRIESMKAIEREAKRMTGIVNSLLTLAEIESGPMVLTDDVALGELLTEEAERARVLAGSRKIVIGCREDLTVKGDAQRLRQLLSNLVGNAVKYTPENGTIELSLFKDDPWACLNITDTGIGIAPEHLPHIFDRFYRIDKARSRSSGGSGLGLAIVKGIAEQHGGSITVTSEPGRRSTFTVRLKL